MKKADAIQYFGSQTKLAQALSIAPASVSQWGDEVPELRAFQIERLTSGRLKAVPPKSSNSQSSLTV